MRHVRQLSNYDCGSAAFSSIVGISPLEAIRECGTKKSGTSSRNVQKALTARNIKNKSIYINLPFECVFTHLKLLSKQYPIYVCANFISNSGKGRNSHRSHAIAIKDEKVFDPAEENELDLDCIGHLYNKQLLIKEIILVGIE